MLTLREQQAERNHGSKAFLYSATTVLNGQQLKSRNDLPRFYSSLMNYHKGHKTLDLPTFITAPLKPYFSETISPLPLHNFSMGKSSVKDKGKGNREKVV